MGETPLTKHVPSWLPAFPDPHTFIHTPVWNERDTHPREDKIEQARQRRKAERSLLSLQQRLLLYNGSVQTFTSSIVRGISAAQDQGNKHVSPIALHSKLSDDEAVVANRVSVLEAFALAIEPLKSVALCEEGQEGKTVVPAVRPTVHFKFRTGKKLIGEALNTRHQEKKDILGTAYLAGREEERDDKKRRAEYILKQSMENPQELTVS